VVGIGFVLLKQLCAYSSLIASADHLSHVSWLTFFSLIEYITVYSEMSYISQTMLAIKYFFLCTVYVFTHFQTDFNKMKYFASKKSDRTIARMNPLHQAGYGC